MVSLVNKPYLISLLILNTVILNGTDQYVDQSALNAAIESRLLILNRIEMVKRNIKLVLNKVFIGNQFCTLSLID